jgi:hypothetical protein
MPQAWGGAWTRTNMLRRGGGSWRNDLDVEACEGAHAQHIGDTVAIDCHVDHVHLARARAPATEAAAATFACYSVPCGLAHEQRCLPM